jgi:hypothetical protein
MEEYLKAIPNSILIIIVLLLSGLFVHLFRRTLDKLDDAFEGINTRLDIVCINQESTDYALNQCKLSNGKPFIEHRDTKKAELLKELEIRNAKK